jgi:filamentous hemagglutinin
VLAAAEKSKPGTIAQFEADKRAEIAEACSGGTPVSCQTMTAAAGTALAWPLLPGAAATTSLIGASGNAVIGYAFNGTVNPNDVLFAFWTGAVTANTGWVATIGWNAVSGAGSSYLKGDDPLSGGAISGAAAGFGYGIGGKLIGGKLDDFVNPNWKNWQWVDVGMGISKPLPLSPVPAAIGGIFNSGITESISDQTGKAVKENQGVAK